MPATSRSQKTAVPDVSRISYFRNLYTRVLLDLQAQDSPQSQQHPIIGITSAIAGEGKTTIASGLAAALAEDGALLGFGREPDSILEIECNVTAPPEVSRLAMRSGPGLIELLRGECPPEAAIRASAVERLSVLPVGAPAHSFPLAIRTAALPDVLGELRSRFGLIILDLPSVLNSTDTEVLARLADKLILVVRAEVTAASNRPAW